MGANASRTVTDLSAGAHSVELGGVADNCTLSGDNPRTVTVTAGQPTAVAFSVSCTTPSPTTGSLRVSANTSGPSPDPNGYTLSVDGGAALELAVNGSRTIANLAPGAHSAELAGIAPNCTIA